MFVLSTSKRMVGNTSMLSGGPSGLGHVLFCMSSKDTESLYGRVNGVEKRI